MLTILYPKYNVFMLNNTFEFLTENTLTHKQDGLFIN